jgi:hypothetical protein
MMRSFLTPVASKEAEMMPELKIPSEICTGYFSDVITDDENESVLGSEKHREDEGLAGILEAMDLFSGLQAKDAQVQVKAFSSKKYTSHRRVPETVAHVFDG